MNVNIDQQEDFCLFQGLSQLYVKLKGDGVFTMLIFADLKWPTKDITGCSFAT